jgi:hypothetical protein
MRLFPVLALVACLVAGVLPPVHAADLTAGQAHEIIARDGTEPEFPFNQSLPNPLAVVGGTQQDLERLEAEVARSMPFGGDAEMFAILTFTADPRLQRLADRFQGIVSLPDVRRLAPDAAAALAGRVNTLDLSGLEELTPETAAALATQGDLRIRVPPGTPPETLLPLTAGGHLTLRGVDDPEPEFLEVVAKAAGGLMLPDTVTLRPESARILAAEAVVAELPALKKLPLDVATALGSGRPDLRLTLDGVEEISVEAAAALRRQTGVMCSLGGLRRLSPGVAKALVDTPGDLYLRGLESLDAETAAILARHKRAVTLTVSRPLDAEAIRPLNAHRHYLRLGSREPLSAEAAAAICGRRAQTSLTVPGLDLPAARTLADGVKTFMELILTSPPPGDVVDVLATNRRIFFDHNLLTTLSVAAAKALAGHPNVALSFARLVDISPELAAALATNNNDPLALNSLKALTPEVARALALHQGDLQLMGIESLDREAAAALAAHGGSLHLGLKKVAPDVARLLARHRGGLHCDLLDSIDPRTAAALARGPEWLSFNGLLEIDVATARALAAHDGGLLLIGLSPLPPEVAEPLLADRPGAAAGRQPDVALDFNRLTGLTPRIAEALVERGTRNGEEFDLAGVERLDSAAAARALAATQHRIALPGLQWVTPAAVAALKANPVIEIPADEVLEFLPNADGSTDDFVLP